MSEIDRAVLIVKPKQAFLNWARSLDDESKDLALDDLRRDCSAYLVPQIWQDSDQQAILGECYDTVFEEQLESWDTNEDAWPKSRNLKMFLEWFDVEFHSVVFDLCDAPVKEVEDETRTNTESEHDG